MLKNTLIIFVLWQIATNVVADNSSLNMQLPSMGQSYGSDRVRAGDMECQSAIGGATNLELGVTGIVNNAVSPFESEDPMNPQTKDLGLYARIIIPLDAPKRRLDCTSLYNLELQRKRLELEKLQQELNNLRKLQKGFDN